MSFSLTISDASGASVVFDSRTIKDNFTVKQVSGSSTNTVLSGDVYTDFVYRKRSWEVEFDWLDKTNYEAVLGFYKRQFSLGKYPTVQIVTPFETYSGVAAMDLNEQTITNQCGVVEGVEIIFRETSQQ